MHANQRLWYGVELLSLVPTFYIGANWVHVGTSPLLYFLGSKNTKYTALLATKTLNIQTPADCITATHMQLCNTEHCQSCRKKNAMLPI